MFDTLEEAIMMITDSQLSFFNKPALSLFKRIQTGGSGCSRNLMENSDEDR